MNAISPLSLAATSIRRNLAVGFVSPCPQMGKSGPPPFALLLMLLVFALALPAPATAETGDARDIYGLWVDHKLREKQKVAVLIEDCGGDLCGRIVWLKKAVTANGIPKRDLKNSDTALRQRPLCGLKVMNGFRQTKKNTWSEGHIYNPSSGKFLNSTISLLQDGSLRIRAYLGMPLFGKTLQWVRPQENLLRCNDQPIRTQRIITTDAGR